MATSRRTYVLTGSASGIGAATRSLLEGEGARVVGVDIRDAEIVADLSTTAGRAALLDGVRSIAGEAIDGVIACAGIGSSIHGPGAIVRVNYFGAIATLADLRPLLARGESPRAVVIASIAMLLETVDEELVEACLADDEEAAVGLTRDGSIAYGSSKRAVARWVRRNAITPPWAEAGIALNAIAPGLVDTPIIADALADPERRAEMTALVPSPLQAVAEPTDIAQLLTWLASPANRFVTGQVIFIDGGFEALARGDSIW